MEELTPWLTWGRVIIGCLTCYYVIKDSAKHKVPYRNLWIVLCFIFFPMVCVYLYYKGHLKRKEQMSPLAKRQLEIEIKQRETRQRLRLEKAAWEKARKKEMALNREAEEKLEREMEAERKKRAAAHKKRMQELAEERELQEAAAAKTLHIK